MQAPSFWRAFFYLLTTCIGIPGWHDNLWILPGIFLIPAAMLVYNHIQQVKHHKENKVAIGEQTDY
jgi:hypothetical protein